jgi:two-component system, sensor histidine kinase YesM
MEPTKILQDSSYKRRLFVRYFGMTLIPVLFFLLTGTLSVVLAQRYVSRELAALDLRNLRQARDAVEVVLRETNYLALSMSTDPEFYHSTEKVLTSTLATIEDLKLMRSLTSGINSAVNTRQYLRSMYVYVRSQPLRMITTTDAIVDVVSFADTAWLAPALERKDEIGYWLSSRPLVLLPSLRLTTPVLSLYRNMLGASSFENKGIIAANMKIEYFQGILDSLKSSESQRFAIFDPKDALIVKSKDFEAASPSPPPPGEAGSNATFEIRIGGEPYVLTVLKSELFPLTYCSYTKASEVYKLSNTLLKLSALFASISLVAGLLLMYIMARRNFRNIEAIADIIAAAERGKNLPEPAMTGNDSFSSLTYSILKTFVEHKYLKLRQTNLELLALQAQMNPHFIFNTLTTISCKALEFTGSPNAVTAMIERLARILAYSQENPRAGVRFNEELLFTKDYLEIQRIRFHDRFRVEWDIEKGTEGCRVIKLLLQPLVENSIYHGINEREGPGLIRVSAKREGRMLRLRVEDDGVGIADAELSALRARIEAGDAGDEHIGLANTVRRLGLFFSGEAKAEIRSESGKGTVVELLMPALDA